MRTARRAPFVLVALLALVGGACGGTGELGGPTPGGTVAAKVGDVEITNAALEDETELWALNPEFLQAVGVEDPGRPGRRTTALTSFVLSHRILSEQAKQLSAATGYTPTQDEVDQVIASIDQNFTAPGAAGSLFEVYPEPFRQRLGHDLAYQNNLQNQFGPDTTAPDVEVNPRYGRADVLDGGLVQVSPPTGPLPSPGRLAPSEDGVGAP